jgi:predicted ATPase
VFDLCGVKEGDEQGPGQARTRLGERIARHVDVAKRQQVTEGLAELCGLTAASEGAQGQGARSDTGAIEERISAAWVEFLAAECAAHPVVLVLEDLQWSDAASLRLVDVALRELGDRPLLVLALGRPEVKELFPGLWEGRSFQEIRLPGLSRKASERLVRDVLRDRATPEVVTRIVAQSEGNALLLEELIRAAMEDGGELPDTVLAVLQARFLKLEPGARRVLRAASIFGETFWRGGLLELLGPERQTEDEIDRWLGILVEGGAVVRSAESRFPNELQFAFRHGLLRDAAYSLVPEGDRRVGHRLAGGYLERVGERDPRILADHFERGGEMKRAAMYHAQILSAQA